jgi:hypothetical protein
MLMSVTAGSEQVGGAFEMFVGAIMLGINKSLAQKHGAGGAAGPKEFLNMFRKGQLEPIRKGLEGGQGFIGELGALNKQVQAELREKLLVMGAGEGGMGRLKDFFKTEGIEEVMSKELQKGNLVSIVDRAVQELDLYQIIVRMFEM